MTEESTPRRRRRIRRQGLGSGVTDSSVASANPAADPEEDGLDLEQQVQASAERFTPPHPSQAEQEFTPANRMRDVRERTRGGAYEREYRLQLLHRMLMRRVPLDEIARELDVSVNTILSDRKELYNRLRKEAQNLDIHTIVGETIGFYTEARGMALRVASSNKHPMNVRLAALRTANTAMNDQHRFLNSAGVYDVLRYTVNDSEESDDLSRLMEITENILSGHDELDQASSGLPPLVEEAFDEEEEHLRLL